MKKPVLARTLVVLAALVACPILARAQYAPELKPAAVVALPSYDSLKADINLMGELTGRPHLGDGLEGMLNFVTQGKGLAGLDKTRPAGIFAATDGKEVGVCIFLPVTDLGRLMAVAQALDERRVKELEDGVYEVQAKGRALYVQETHKGWAYVVENKDHFQYVPEDPAKLLAGLNRRYDAAVRVYVSNLPEDHREKLLAGLEKKIRTACKRHHAKHKKGHGQDSEQGEIEVAAVPVWNAELAEYMQRHARDAAREIETLTFGVALDNDLEQGVIEVTAVAVEGSATAKELAQIGQLRTRFGGFDLPGAALTARGTGPCPVPSTGELDSMIEQMRDRAHKKIESEGKSAERASAARQIADSFLDVVKQTVAAGRHDGAVSVALDEDAATLVGGRFVADGPKLEATLKMIVEEARCDHSDCVEKMVKLDAGKYHGVNLHVASIPITEKCPKHKKAVKAVGEKLQVVVGVGPKAVYVAAGRDAMTLLKQAIHRSWVAQRWTVPPAECTVDLGCVAEFAEEFGDEKCREKADLACDLLEDAGSADRIHLILLPTRRGLRLRVELDEGVLSVMSQLKQRGW